MPSLKYAFCGSPLKLSNGKTAIDLFEIVAADGDVDLGRTNWKISKPVATTANTIVRATILRPVWCVIDLPDSISDSRTIPSGVISNAHEKTSATGKPAISTNTTSRTAQFGISKNGKTCVAT